MMTNDRQPPRSLIVEWLHGAETIMTLHVEISSRLLDLDEQGCTIDIEFSIQAFNKKDWLWVSPPFHMPPISAHIVVLQRGTKLFHICSSLTHELGQTYQALCQLVIYMHLFFEGNIDAPFSEANIGLILDIDLQSCWGWAPNLYHYRNRQICRVFLCLPSVFHRALGEQVFCRVLH